MSGAGETDRGGRVVRLPDAEATARAGEALAALVRGGDAIALAGELGAGKTTLVAGLARALGAGPASSPTFALVHEYPAGRLVVWHVDLYRIEREAELVELGLDDLVGDPRGVCLVEWADRFAVMPPDHLRLALAHAPAAEPDGPPAARSLPPGGRTLVATGTGPRGEALARDLTAALLASPG